MSGFEDADGVAATFDETAEDLFENAPCGYLSTTPEGVLLRVNATFLRWTGYSRDELVGIRRFQDLLSVGGRIYHETHYAPMLRMQGSAREIAVDIVAADGERLPVLVNSVLVRAAGGAPIAVRTTVFDATERKLYERELLAARNRERAARERTEVLQRLTAALADAPDARTIATTVTEAVTAALGADRAGFALHDPDRDALDRLTGEGVPDAVPAAPEFREVGDGAKVCLPCGGVGVLWLEWDAPRSFDPDERAFLVACAIQAGSALERARLHQVTQEVAHSLQRSLLAGALPTDARFEIATDYRSAVEHLEVGGDWYDAFVLPRGTIGIVVGDVVGRGLAAASAMGQLRSAVRALAGAGFSPGEVVRHLDTFVEHVAPARYATLVVAEVEPGEGAVTLAAAGHLPPVVIRPDGEPELFMEGRSPPLGFSLEGHPRREGRLTLSPGAGLLIYTDGLVERRTEAIDAGLDRLLATVRDADDTSVAALARTLPDRLLEGDVVPDDVCLLAYRRLS
jgi:PAS domain S-box-containing protein